MRSLVRYSGCIMLLVFLLAVPGLSQKFQSLNTDFPLPYTEKLYQDSYGFLWIATVDGVVKFDGYSIKRYFHDPSDPSSLSGNNTRSILEDHHGRIWIGYWRDGVDLFDRDTEIATPLSIDDSNVMIQDDLSVYSIIQGYRGTIWFGSNYGLIGMDESRDSFTFRQFLPQADDSQSLYGNTVVQMHEDSKNRLWVGTTEGLNLFDQENGTFVNPHINQTFPATMIMDIAEDFNQGVWVAPRFGNYRLYKLNEASQEFEPYPEFVGGKWGEFRLAFNEPTRTMWVSARGGGVYSHNMQTGDINKYIFEGGNFHGQRELYPLMNLTDCYGNIWFAGPKLQKWPATYKPFHSISSNQFRVVSVYADEGYIWYNSQAPYRWDRSSFKASLYIPEGHPKDLRSPRPVPRVYAIRDLDDHTIVIVMTRNVLIWDKRNDTFEDYFFDRGGPFRDFEITENGIWICGNQGSPIFFDLETFEYHNPDAAQSIQSLDAVDSSPDGRLWFGSSHEGVFMYDQETGEIRNYLPDPEKPESSLSSIRVHTILATSDTSIWVGTDLGLNRLNPATGHIDVYRLDDGLPSEHISSLLEDNEHRIWFGSNSGLVRFDPVTLEVQSFTDRDGLINKVYSHRSCYKDNNGWLYFGGDRGVDFFDPAELGKNRIAPDLYVNAVRIQNEPVEIPVAPENLKELTLDYSDEYVEVDLLALHLTTPESNSYAYRIRQIRDSWVNLGTRRTISLTDLNPGKYTIEAKAANGDGIWSEEKIVLRLTVTPPFWQTWWFYTLGALVVGSLIYGIYRYRVAQIRKREGIKTAFNKRIAEIEMTALRAQMNPHFLFNSLNSVKSLIAHGEDEKATKYLTRFSQLIRQVLNNSSKKFVRLQEDLQALRLYLELEKMRFQNFEYEVNVEEGVNADFVEVPPLLLQPYVENAVWHGLMHKLDGDRRLTIDVTRNGSILEMMVTDNGIGRERAKQLATRSSSKKESLGMKLTGDRLNLLREIYGQDATVEVEDLPNGSGTRVILRLPVPE